MKERVADALNRCRVPGETLSSILFGVEKAGTQLLINTAAESLTNDSSLLYGTQGRPVKLKRHLNSAAMKSVAHNAAFWTMPANACASV
ncbi:hypothetical protein [Mycobacterium genavense]|uniref:hypothetical protein n=1 Tax=Mycobacterium genavense TaxID=36812 RepID=UPI0012EB0F61|nr:hypothetical protein [Mycobacterium genavense]